VSPEAWPGIIAWALTGLSGLLALTGISMAAVLNTKRGPRRKANP
jgi:hypothetical protein